MFQLTQEEFANLKSQFATSSLGWGGCRKAPLVFTEHGALQAANVLKSAQANKMSVYIVRTFVRLREMALTNEKLARKVEQLESLVAEAERAIELLQERRTALISAAVTGKIDVRGLAHQETDAAEAES